MTSPASALSARTDSAAAAATPSRPSHRGFTLVELLIVIFIVALLATLILGAVNMAQKKARIAKTRSDLAAIASALEQYKSDFRSYPGQSEPINTRTILAQALIGPGPATEDGAEGSGFRIPDPATNTFSPNSKKWEAYLSPERFQTKRMPPVTGRWVILDHFGNPIRYYPKRRNFNPKTVNPGATPPTGLVGDETIAGIFDLRDGEHPELGYSPAAIMPVGTSIDLNPITLQIYLGDDGDGFRTSPNNIIDANETLNVGTDFVLASCGPDGFFVCIVSQDDASSARQKFTKSDDILNFER
jgi:prepilin-type N-terminal cleavage/methylation domain-containing protein